MSYITDLVPTVAHFLGNDTAAQDIACIICQFRGYTCRDRDFMQWRAVYLTRVFRAQAEGCSSVWLYHDMIPRGLNAISGNQTYVNWLVVDLQNMGYAVRPYELGAGFNGICFVSWEESTCGTFCLYESDSDSED